MKERSIIDRLDSLESNDECIKKLLNQIIEERQDNSKKNLEIQNNQPVRAVQQNPKEIFNSLLIKSQKSYRWFGTSKEFCRSKTLSIISCSALMLCGFIATIATSISLNLFIGLSIFEIVWMIFALVILIQTYKAKQVYKVDLLVSNCPFDYSIDQYGMKYLLGEKKVFRVFRVFAVIASILNIICVWFLPNTNNQIFATIIELLFLGSVIFEYLTNTNFFAQYCIALFKFYDKSSKDFVTYVLPPLENKLIPEEQYKNRYHLLYK